MGDDVILALFSGHRALIYLIEYTSPIRRNSCPHSTNYVTMEDICIIVPPTSMRSQDDA